MSIFGTARSRALTAVLLAIVWAFVIPSCQKMPLVAPSGTALTLIPATHVLPVNGETEITAVLIEGGQQVDTDAIIAGVGTPVHNGTVVTFKTTLGRLEPAEAKTTGGRATVRLIGDGRSGTATITAFSGPAVNSIDINVGAAAAAFIAVTASPQTLPSTGGTASIAAHVEDVQGNGLAGLPVTFQTTRGTLTATTATTNASGVASTSLTTTQEATVTATTGGASAALSDTVIVTIKPRTGVTLTPPASATVGVPATFTVTPNANAVLTDVEIDFGDGTSASLGGITSLTSITHPFRSPGVRTVTATATDSEGGRGTVSTQVSVAPLQVTLSANVTGNAVALTAVPTPNAIIDRFEWDFGDGTTFVTNGNQTVHGYDSPGRRVITVRAVPIGNGTAATGITTVTIN
jgi:hypothetical protein